MANSIPSFPCLHWEISIMANSIPLNWLMAKSILWLWCIPNLALGLIPHSVYGLVRFPVDSLLCSTFLGKWKLFFFLLALPYAFIKLAVTWLMNFSAERRCWVLQKSGPLFPRIILPSKMSLLFAILFLKLAM